MPVISSQTQSRKEGYFRLEWRLAVERMQRMSDRAAFLVPVVIDTARRLEPARVFRRLQPLRGWSDEQVYEVFTGSSGTGGAA
jgi:hypothetical protein